MSARPLIHIGYHKTATTWMQRQLFTPSHGYHQIADHEDVFRHIVEPHGLRFSAQAMQAHIQQALPQLKTGEVPVISSEILSGHPFFGGRESDVYAARLAQIAPDARILISIRAQMKILPSVYMQYVLRGGTTPYQDFFSAENPLGFFTFSPDHFKYDRLVGLYQQTFGKENVCVVMQESLRSDINRLAKDIADFSGNTLFDGLKTSQSKENASYPEYAVPLLRRINHLKKNVLNPTPMFNLGSVADFLFRTVGYACRSQPMKKNFGDRRPVSDFVSKTFDGYYHDSNQRLSVLLDNKVDLSKYS
ncbi:MAG: hypothetical protein AAF066_03985 [Pseudomonadota bacterium]